MSDERKYQRIEGATHVCELRPRAEGSGFELVSRARILYWSKDSKGRELPVTQYGMVSHRAFWPNSNTPDAGQSFLEVRRPDGKRGWAVPWKDKGSMLDAGVKGYLHDTARYCAASPAERARIREAEERGGAGQMRSFALTPEEDAAVAARVRAVASKAHIDVPGQPRATATVNNARRELEAIKRRMEDDK